MKKKGSPQRVSSIWADALAFALLVIIGGLLHFTWDRISGIAALRWLAVFMPVNESNWEHAKLAAWPLLIWAILMLHRGAGLKGIRQWLLPTALCIWSAYLVMFALHSAVPHAFGDIGALKYIGSFMVGIAHGMMLFRITPGWNRSAGLWPLGAVMLAAKLCMLIFFTYYPPALPLFLDGPSGLYGILP